MTDRAHISAVIISYHGIDFIADCLNSLKADLEGYEHEIIVVDNHSTDGTLEYIEKHHPEIKLIKNASNAGFAKAVNQGIDAARYKTLWLLNQDIRIRKGCLDALLNCMQKLERPGMVGPKLVGFDSRLQKFCRRFPGYRHLFCELSGLSRLFPRSRLFNGWKMGDFDHLESRPVQQPMGAAMLVPREAINVVGRMDESFGIFFNDVDFCRRLHEAGYENFYCAEAVIEHFGGGSISRQKPKMIWLSHLAMFRYFRKWERRRKAPFVVKVLRTSLAWLAGGMLVLAAGLRSLYHYLKSFI
ncbi:MAG: glycosyltransferase family 2 protein [FCB group bacterium]|nr:glycosyltransferase family 2 protein [FCB group bacterium]